MIHNIAPATEKPRLHAINDAKAALKVPGQWHYNQSRTIRLRDIEPNHSSHSTGIDLMTGNYKEDLESLPWHTFECKEGQNLAYLIDLLRSQEETL
jgi:hypothetical protein